MKLIEYEAKKLLRNDGITIPDSTLLSISDDGSKIFTDFPVILKSQVAAGRRGKRGGVKKISSTQDFSEAFKRMSRLQIDGQLPQNLLAEEVLSISHEYYFSLTIDREHSCINILAHRNGGIEIEENSIDQFLSIKLSGTSPDFTDAGEKLSLLYNISEKASELAKFVELTHNCFVKNDALLLEINPLVLTTNGALVAADCKMELDDGAAFRHPDWSFETKKTNTNFVTLDPEGTIATIANGAGLAMATVDAIAARGHHPVNFLDIGGGANEASISSSFNTIMKFSDVQAIVINIFAGITRCDEVAKAIFKARSSFPSLPKLYIRLAGTNAEQATLLLASTGEVLYKNLDELLTALDKEIQ